MGDRAYKQLHTQLGLCTSCSRPALSENTRCLIHWYSHQLSEKSWQIKNSTELAEKKKAKRDKWREENKCSRCGAPLMSEEANLCMSCKICANYPVMRGVI